MSHRSNKGLPQPNKSGSSTSAAGMAARVGFREPPSFTVMRDGGMRRFCALFNRRFDQMARTTRPEWRDFSRTEHAFGRSV